VEVKAHNPLKAMLYITVEGKWYNVEDFSLIVGFHLKLAGVDFRTSSDLADCLLELVRSHFVEVHPTNDLRVRIRPYWFGESDADAV
jgi:hypothetical protein